MQPVSRSEALWGGRPSGAHSWEQWEQWELCGQWGIPMAAEVNEKPGTVFIIAIHFAVR